MSESSDRRIMKKHKFDTLGVMIDMSRNAVMSLSGLKRFLPLLKKMGYNCVMLYTEDTYEVDGEPYFGYMRGRYSKSEMKEIDSFASSLGIEIIPCIQTLAHLNALKKWGQHPYDCSDILLVDDPRTYELIDRMFSTLSECFTSRKIHIGMDEADMLGRGEHLKRHGYEPSSTLMKRHLAKVSEMAKSYGYSPMMWSDMFFWHWSKSGYYVKDPSAKMPDEYIDALPKDVIPVYWDYYHTNEESYNIMFDIHKQLSNNIWFAGGIWSWRGIIPHNVFSIRAMTSAINSCVKNNVKNIFMTMWGDNGGECSHFSQLPSLFYIAQYAKGERDEEKIKKKFKALIGLDFDECMTIDDVNNIAGNEKLSSPQNPSKYMLYSDCFNGFLDLTVKSGGGRVFEENARTMSALAKKSRKYGYVFDTAAKICDVMAIKYELGVKTRAAYQSGDKDELRRLANNDYAKVIKLINIFAKAFEKQWMLDNKPYGFDVQDMRIGALVRRIDSCRRRLLDYANGKTDRIEELEEKLLPFKNSAEGESIAFVNAFNAMTSSVI